MPSDGLSLDMEQVGPDSATVDEAVTRLLQGRHVRELLQDASHRLMGVEWLEGARKARESLYDALRATVYDYSNDRVLRIDTRLSDLNSVKISESSEQPLPNHEEYLEAASRLERDEELGSMLQEGQLIPYPAMPGVLPAAYPDGRPARVLAIGVLPVNGRGPHQIVGVDMSSDRILRYEENAPEGSVAHNPICGASYAGQATTSRGTPGTAKVTVTQAGKVLWRFQTVRPAASSGNRGSGVELRFVDFRGTRVLYRAHVPILNVLYNGNVCGPYRDWQWQEGMFDAKGSDPVPGFRLCSTPARTILESGSDQGNFRGVAIYVQGQEVVLVSEMEAGWYRYISEWRLGSSGVIRPRFGFAATSNSCVCTTHHHHAYWRFDFDIRSAGGNQVQEFNDPSLLFAGSNWHTKANEIRRYRDPARKRKWRIRNKSSGEGYDLIPGPNDGKADAYARGDVWILRYRGSELDDGHTSLGPPTEADLDNFVNGEAVDGQDVVVWYGGHFVHSPEEEHGEHAGHQVGPDLVPVNWRTG